LTVFPDLRIVVHRQPEIASMTRNTPGILPILVLVLALGAGSPAAAAGNGADPPQRRPSAEAMLIDGLIYRPLYLAGTAIGAGVFLVTLPFSLFGGNAGDAGERLVLEPAREAFGRCLGCFEQQDSRW
jgi:hypothetical protein